MRKIFNYYKFLKKYILKVKMINLIKTYNIEIAVKK